MTRLFEYILEEIAEAVARRLRPAFAKIDCALLFTQQEVQAVRHAIGKPVAKTPSYATVQARSRTWEEEQERALAEIDGTP